MTMMKSQAGAALLGLTTLAILFFSGAHAAKITFTNKCSFTVWPGILTSDQKSQFSLTGFELATGSSLSLNAPSRYNGAYEVSTLCKFGPVYFEIPDLSLAPSPWSSRFFGRTRCSTDASGKFTCATADCGSGQVSCNGNGAVPPATLVEITIAENGGRDFYDVSLVDGFNLPMSVAPQGGTGECKTSTCPADVNAVCPAELQVKGSDGSVIACKSACLAFNEPKYCCTPPNDKPETCPPTEYSQLFKTQCPQAYSYAYDDNSSTFTCNASPDYVITFCP